MLQIAEEVRAALAAGRAVVALESSIVAHGFPRPDNLEVGLALEAAVRQEGAVPATVAVLGGMIRVGLARPELEHLARASQVVKCSSRDLAWVVAQGRDGATTVAATTRIAALAGIGVFATGGIGGVHRNVPGQSATFDVSADLMELGRAPTAVVCAGAKSILDLPATLEALEALGVPVIGFGTDQFPAFHTAESGLPLGQRVDGLEGLAAVVRVHRGLASGPGILICNPPPAAVAMPAAEIGRLVGAALAEAAAAGVHGGALTPFLLGSLDRLSGGRSRVVNRALAESNARLAAGLAMRLAKA